MTWVAILIALGAMGVSVGTFRRNKALTRSLDKEKRENDELKTTLVEVLDEEGNIVGQLALPGQITNKRVSDRLAIAEKSVSTIQEEIRTQTKKLRTEVDKSVAEMREAKGALKAAQSREGGLEKTLAEVVDGDGTVLAQLRLPGKKVEPPNRTPCGDMCKLAFYQEAKRDRYGDVRKRATWNCTAGQGLPCDQVRSQFVDGNGQCVLWVRDDDVPAEDGTMPSAG